jgi:DNA invertase Pin-like site-specific DNA recombinase
MKCGYARISTEDQNPAFADCSIEETERRAVELSGATIKRPALLQCLKKMERGDTLTSGNSTG